MSEHNIIQGAAEGQQDEDRVDILSFLAAGDPLRVRLTRRADGELKKLEVCDKELGSFFSMEDKVGEAEWIDADEMAAKYDESIEGLVAKLAISMAVDLGIVFGVSPGNTLQELTKVGLLACTVMGWEDGEDEQDEQEL